MDDPESAAAAVIDDALARAVVYRALSLGFLTPTAERLRASGAHDGFQVLSAALSHLDRQAGGGRPMAPSVERLAAGVGSGLEALEADFVCLFGHTARGAACAFETEYGVGQGFQQPHQLADIAGYYLAFGLRPRLASDVRADHIACECEFMDFLNRKQAVLIAGLDAAPDRDTLEATEQAERTFLRDHLGRFGRAFATRVATQDAGGYFGALGRVLLSLIEGECARVGVSAGPIDLTVSPDTADETPMLCGTASEASEADEANDLIQIQRSACSR